VALKLDRLFRNAGDALATVEEWHEAGIHLHLVDMGGMTLNSASSMGKMFLTMLAGFAEFERNVISERTSAALRHKKAHGEVYGRGVYGFDAVDGKLVPNTQEQAVLKRIKALRAAAVSFHGIADTLNADGVPSKTGGQWHGFTVQKMLRSGSE
jgi:DNA invertase Pin-like site-specific DNA recombinase